MNKEREIKERPILFNDEMVRALLDGRKTQTRRLVKPQPANDWSFETAEGAPMRLGCITSPHPKKGRFGVFIRREIHPASGKYEHDIIPCPYGQPGDRLWVREAHAYVPEPAYRRSTGIYQQINPADDYEACVYRENFDRARSFPWRPSIHMPRWACRLLLEVTAVRVERLQDMNAEDARAEGCPGGHGSIPGYGYSASPGEHFRHVWQSINGADSWDANPWVWVVEFKRINQHQEADAA